MLTILHGDNVDASRNELYQIKAQAKGREIRELVGLVDMGALTQALESSSLFGGDTIVIIENLFSKIGRKGKASDEFVNKLLSASESTDVVVWEGKELTPALIKSFGMKAQIKLFKMPLILFQLLDSLRPKNTKTFIELFRQFTQNEAPELFYSMLVTRLRQLVMAKDGVTPDRIAPWQLARLTNQARSFTIEKLLTMERQLLDSEYSLKSGSSPFTMLELIEQFIISI